MNTIEISSQKKCINLQDKWAWLVYVHKHQTNHQPEEMPQIEEMRTLNLEILENKTTVI